ncbi:hypothetical protein LEMLEM_LOCUS16252, partial [Lemmus lemmus]
MEGNWESSRSNRNKPSLWLQPWSGEIDASWIPQLFFNRPRIGNPFDQSLVVWEEGSVSGAAIAAAWVLPGHPDP